MLRAQLAPFPSLNVEPELKFNVPKRSEEVAAPSAGTAMLGATLRTPAFLIATLPGHWFAVAVCISNWPVTSTDALGNLPPLATCKLTPEPTLIGTEIATPGKKGTPAEVPKFEEAIAVQVNDATDVAASAATAGAAKAAALVTEYRQ